MFKPKLHVPDDVSASPPDQSLPGMTLKYFDEYVGFHLSKFDEMFANPIHIPNNPMTAVHLIRNCQFTGDMIRASQGSPRIPFHHAMIYALCMALLKHTFGKFDPKHAEDVRFDCDRFGRYSGYPEYMSYLSRAVDMLCSRCYLNPPSPAVRASVVEDLYRIMATIRRAVDEGIEECPEIPVPTGGPPQDPSAPARQS